MGLTSIGDIGIVANKVKAEAVADDNGFTITITNAGLKGKSKRIALTPDGQLDENHQNNLPWEVMDCESGNNFKECEPDGSRRVLERTFQQYDDEGVGATMRGRTWRYFYAFSDDGINIDEANNSTYVEVVFPAPRGILSTGLISPGTLTLKRDEFLDYSPNHRLYMQADGNLVIYDKTTGAALWSSGTPYPLYCQTHVCEPTAIFQGDGNLVLYRRGEFIASNAYWSSRTEGRGIQLQLRTTYPYLRIIDMNSQAIFY